MFHVSGSVFRCMSLLFDYMCMRLPFIPWSIAGVPSCQALPGYRITALPSVCVPDVIGALAVRTQSQTEKSRKLGNAPVLRSGTGSWVLRG